MLLQDEDQETGHRLGNASSSDTHTHTYHNATPLYTHRQLNDILPSCMCVIADCCVSTPGKEQLSPSCFQLLKLEFSPLCYMSMVILHVLLSTVSQALSGLC